MKRMAIALAAAAPLMSAQLVAQEAADAKKPIAAWNRFAAMDESDGSLAEHGAAVFNNWCAACHSRDPKNAGTASLQIKYGDAVAAALEDRTDLSAEVITVFVRNGIAMMPGFRKVEISDADLAALVAYLTEPGRALRNSRDR